MKKGFISELIKNKGLIINMKGKDDILKIRHNEIKKLFEKFGIILFKNFIIDPKKLTSFTDHYTQIYSPDALRRKIRFSNQNIRNVDSGNIRVDLHSESSFNPAWPEIIWFYCNNNTAKGGETIICDGLLLWQKLNLETKNFFQLNPIKYKLSIPIVKRINKTGKKIWPMNSLGVFNSFIDWDEGNLHLNQIRFAVQESRINNYLCFANHLIINYKDEPQIISRLMNNNKRIPKKFMNEIMKKSAENTLELKLEKNDFLMLDNKRFMHGRRAFTNKGVRDIVNIQTFKANFAYGETIRKYKLSI